MFLYTIPIPTTHTQKKKMNVSDEERQDLCGYHMLIPILSDDELGGDGRKNDEDVEHFF